MITTHYVCCCDKKYHWSYKKVKKKLYTVLATSNAQDIPSDIVYILYHCSGKNAKKIVKILKKYDYEFIEYE